MVGLIQLALGLVRAGFLTSFLSHPVVSGFTSAAAIIIGTSQVKYVFGLSIPRTESFLENLVELFHALPETHILTACIGLLSISLMLSLKYLSKIHPKLALIPGPLLVVAVFTTLSAIFRFDLLGVKIVGLVPIGLPPFAVPLASLSELISLFPLAVSLGLVAYMESVAVGKAMCIKHNYELLPNQEFVALGLANIGCGCFSGFAGAGGFGRTAVNEGAGAKSQFAALISAIIIILFLLFLTLLVYFLPLAVLGAIVIMAVASLFDWKELKWLWEAHRQELVLWFITFFATLILSIEYGIIVGVVCSLVWVIFQSSRPHKAILGRIPSTNIYRSVAYFPYAITEPHVLILRFDASLYFANITYFKDVILNAIIKSEAAAKAGEGLAYQVVVWDASPVSSIDSSGLHGLKDLVSALKAKEIPLIVVSVRVPTMRAFKRVHLDAAIGEENMYRTLSTGVHAATMIVEGKARLAQKSNAD